MIVCSCNVFSDDEIRAAVGDPDGPGTVSQVYLHLGSGAHCGRCTRTVVEVLRQRRADSEEGSP